MSGARPEWIAGTDFIMVHRGLVAALDGDYEAAMVFNRIDFRAGRDGWWTATAAEMQEETCLSEWKLKAAVKRLRDAGFVESERVTAFNPTQRWRVVLEESSVPCGMDSSDTGSVREESSDTVKEESSDTSTKNTKNPLVPSSQKQEPPQRHHSSAIDVTWEPSPGFKTYLTEAYPHVDIASLINRFRLHYFAAQATSKSWEARLEVWAGNDERERLQDLREGTDSMGIPHSQRKTSIVQPAQPGDPDYFDPNDLTV